MATVIDLTNLGDGGFIIRGGQAGDLAGYSVSSAGDINGDGYADLIVGAPQANGNGNHSGRAYVLFGHKGGFDPIDLSQLSLADGFAITGQAAAQRTGLAGASVSSAGDFNGDGYDDFLVGSPGNGSQAGAGYLIYGKAGGFANLFLDGLSRDDGFKISGGTSDQAGTSVSAAGDVNGDGFADVIVGAPGDAGRGTSTGAAYVIFGAAGGYESIDLEALPLAKGFTIRGGAELDFAGASVGGGGDINGDGLADIVIGVPRGDDGGLNAGEAYVIFGKTDGFGINGVVDLASLSPADGFEIVGDVAADRTGTSVASAGDVNADGYADLIVGAPEADKGGTSSGEAYVILGKAGGFGTIDLTNLTPDAGFAIQGNLAGDVTGRSVSAAGDVNGDGFGDVIVGAKGSDGGGFGTGAAYVIYGKADGFGTIDLTNLTDGAGFAIQGDMSGDAAGFSVSAAGDVNGDGFDDVIVGAPYGDDLGTNAGNAYVIYGTPPTGDVRRDGTLIDNTIHGGAGNDTLLGRAGDDVLIGAAGNDLVNGQSGNDDVDGGDGDDKVIGGVGDDIMHGGTGNDRLVGGRGNDVLFGGQGTDVLNGGDGADQFHFTATGSSADFSTADRVLGFFQASHDVIDLSDFDARPGSPEFDPFTFIGTSAFSGAGGELRYEFKGNDTVLSADTDGNRIADFVVRIDGHIALTEADFIFSAPAIAPVAGAHLFLSQPDLHADSRLLLA